MKKLISLLLALAVFAPCSVFAQNRTETVKLDDSDITLELTENDTGWTLSGCRPHSFVGELIIPDKVKGRPITKIGQRACSGMDIQSVTMGDSVTEIGFMAFNKCEKLESSKISRSLQTIEDDAFNGCGKLKSITLPDSLTYIDDSAFAGCGIETVTLSKNIQWLGSGVFSGSALKHIEIPEGITTLPYQTFMYCSSLESIVLPSGLKAVGPQAFKDSGIKSLTLPEGTEKIDYGAFEHSKIESIKLPNTLKTIEHRAFFQSALKEIYIPDSVEFIGHSAFRYCHNLEKLRLSENLTSVEDNLLQCAPIVSLKIPDSVKKIGSIPFYGCSMLEAVYLPDNLTFNTYEWFASPFALCDVLTIYTNSDNYNAYAKQNNIRLRPASEFGTLNYGDVLSVLRTSEVAVDFNGTYLPAYTVRDGSVYIIAEDLQECGMKVEYNHADHILNITGEYAPKPSDLIRGKGEYVGNIVKSDIKMYLNGVRVPALSADGYMLIPIDVIANREYYHLKFYYVSEDNTSHINYDKYF